MRGLSVAIAAVLIAGAPLAALAADLKIEGGWARATPPSAPTGAAYFTVLNSGPADRLIGVSTPAAAKAEIHEMATGANMVMTMRPLKDGAAVPAKGRLALAPGGAHVMLMRLKAPLKAGDTLPLTLRFQRAGEIKVVLPVKAEAPAAAPQHNH